LPGLQGINFLVLQAIHNLAGKSVFCLFLILMQVELIKVSQFSLSIIVIVIHAGDNEINCKYCHSARVQLSRDSSLNVCMNCHKNIAEVEGNNVALNTVKRSTMSKIVYSSRLGSNNSKLYW
jgi:DNA-directed RNA polymerase subunit RPC12/RpoP